jgi:NADPH:quinone reductase-like Zn-dependent oxidoreductase
MQSSSIKTIGFLEKEGKVGLGSASRPEKLGPRDVLIKVHYAPISKYDKACMNVEKKEKICGSEGAGIIEDVGQGL